MLGSPEFGRHSGAARGVEWNFHRFAAKPLERL
jgi:hypothetical protein